MQLFMISPEAATFKMRINFTHPITLNRVSKHSVKIFPRNRKKFLHKNIEAKIK